MDYETASDAVKSGCIVYDENGKPYLLVYTTCGGPISGLGEASGYPLSNEYTTTLRLENLSTSRPAFVKEGA